MQPENSNNNQNEILMNKLNQVVQDCSYQTLPASEIQHRQNEAIQAHLQMRNQLSECYHSVGSYAQFCSKYDFHYPITQTYVTEDNSLNDQNQGLNDNSDISTPSEIKPNPQKLLQSLNQFQMTRDQLLQNVDYALLYQIQHHSPNQLQNAINPLFQNPNYFMQASSDLSNQFVQLGNAQLLNVTKNSNSAGEENPLNTNNNKSNNSIDININEMELQEHINTQNYLKRAPNSLSKNSSNTKNIQAEKDSSFSRTQNYQNKRVLKACNQQGSPQVTRNSDLTNQKTYILNKQHVQDQLQRQQLQLHEDMKRDLQEQQLKQPQKLTQKQIQQQRQLQQQQQQLQQQQLQQQQLQQHLQQQQLQQQHLQQQHLQQQQLQQQHLQQQQLQQQQLQQQQLPQQQLQQQQLQQQQLQQQQLQQQQLQQQQLQQQQFQHQQLQPQHSANRNYIKETSQLHSTASNCMAENYPNSMLYTQSLYGHPDFSPNTVHLPPHVLEQQIPYILPQHHMSTPREFIDSSTDPINMFPPTVMQHYFAPMSHAQANQSQYYKIINNNDKEYVSQQNISQGATRVPSEESQNSSETSQKKGLWNWGESLFAKFAPPVRQTPSAVKNKRPSFFSCFNTSLKA